MHVIILLFIINNIRINNDKMTSCRVWRTLAGPRPAAVSTGDGGVIKQ